jgi:hypothetical protein
MHATSIESQIMKMTGMYLSSGRCLLWMWIAYFGMYLLYGVLGSNSRTAAACDPLTGHCRVLNAYSVLKASIQASIATVVAVVVLLAAVWVTDMVAWIRWTCTKDSPKKHLDQHCRLHRQLTTSKQQKQKQEQLAQHTSKDAASSSAADTQLTEQHNSIVLPIEQFHTVLQAPQHSHALLPEPDSNVLQPEEFSCQQANKQYSDVLTREQYCSAQHNSSVPLPAVPDTAVEASAGPLHPDSNALSKQRQVDVWVLAGQSNCVGTNQADGQEMPAAAQPWPGKIFRFDAEGECKSLIQYVLGWISLAAVVGYVCAPGTIALPGSIRLVQL